MPSRILNMGGDSRQEAAGSSVDDKKAARDWAAGNYWAHQDSIAKQDIQKLKNQGLLIKSQKGQNRGYLIQSGSSAVRTGMTLVSWLWYIFISIVIVLIVAGPGLRAIIYLMESLGWFFWVFAIMAGILIGRYKKW